MGGMKLKLVNFYQSDQIKLGVKVAEGIIDIEDALSVFPSNEVETDITTLINGGEASLKKLNTFIEDLPLDNKSYILSEEEVHWAPALTNPEKIICVGLNYRKHADETKAEYPKYPVLFNKFKNALSAHMEEVPVPKTTERLDHEVELGIVIGKEGKYISEKDALEHVFGYCTTNDLSARDIQKRVPQWMTGKTNDGFAPVGPYVVTKDEVGNPDNLRITTTVNGEVRQDSNTSDMIFSCKEIISYVSQYMTLKPGDLIMTGTPEGVILGKPIEERVYLQPGDQVTVEVEGLGALTTRFVEDK